MEMLVVFFWGGGWWCVWLFTEMLPVI